MSAITLEQELTVQIKAAMGTHGMWKSRLQTAIAAGASDITAADVARDDQCDFGKWLHQGISQTARASAKYATVLELHARFHTEAARVLGLAVGGRGMEAKRALDRAAAYGVISSELTREMTAWLRSVA